MNTDPQRPTPETEGACIASEAILPEPTCTVLEMEAHAERMIDFARKLERERDEAREVLEAIGDYLWPNQTGLPNKHRDALLAIKTREKLLLENAEALAEERDDYRRKLELK